MTYNLTNITESQTFAQYLIETNNLVNGYYASLFLLMLFFILYIIMQNYDTRVALLVPSFIVMIIASLFVFLGLVGWSAVVITGVVMGGALIATIWR